LLEPEGAVEMGSAYLKRLLKKFNELTPLVAAAYNAGPHRADHWMNSFGHLAMDEFVEHIPFAETRNYVKKVINNQQIYREIYKNERKIVIPFYKALDYKPSGPVSHREDWETQ
ncbi:MAG: transglycosylase SLT domain-containing protein, partial [Bdellovibrionales bacterium]